MNNFLVLVQDQQRYNKIPAIVKKPGPRLLAANPHNLTNTQTKKPKNQMTNSIKHSPSPKANSVSVRQ
jgi:hypothetical protein